MKITIDNHDGKGPVDYSAAVVAGKAFRIVRRLNQPATCALTLFPGTLPMPARNGRMIVSDDSGVMLFTGYVATEPALELAGRGTEGVVYQGVVSAIGDELLLDRQSLPQIASVGSSSGQALETMLQALDLEEITSELSEANLNVSELQTNIGRTWSESAGALAASVRSSYRLMNGTLTLNPIGSVTHSLNESDGTLSPGGLELSMAKGLVNDVTVCGEMEPCAYVTELFEGDGTIASFDLSEEPWVPVASQSKPMTDSFNGPAFNTQVWSVDDPGAALTLTSNGLTCGGGGSTIGATVFSAISTLELGGGLVVEVGGVQFGGSTSGILN